MRLESWIEEEELSALQQFDTCTISFAGNVAVSHSYAHIFDFGSVVHIGGLEIRPGDLLHGDMHGLLTIPRQLAGKVPRVAMKLRQFEEKVIAFCQSREFSLEQLHRMLQELH